MGITPLVFTDGTAITEAAVRAELDRVKGWVNGGVLLTDIFSATLAKEHVYRPESSGFPKNNIEAQQQQVVESVAGLAEPTAFPSFAGSSGGVIGLDSIRETRTAFLDNLRDGETLVMETMRFEVFQQSDIEVVATCFAACSNDNSSSDSANAGNIRLCYQRLGDAKVVMLASYRKVNASDEFSNLILAKISSMYDTMGYIEDAPAGTYDVWLEYARNGANTSLGQVTVAQPTILVEIFEQ